MVALLELEWRREEGMGMNRGTLNFEYRMLVLHSRLLFHIPKVDSNVFETLYEYL